VVAAPLPPGYTTRAATVDDAPAIAQLIAACQLLDGDQAEMTVEELLDDWQGVNLAEETVAVVAPDGQITGYADLLNRRYVLISVYGHVHPDQRGRGIGTYLVRWGEGWTQDHIDNAPEHARVDVQHFVRSSNAPAQRLLEALGYMPVRTHYVMAIMLDEAPPAPAWPTDLGVRPFVRGQDEQAIYEAGEDAFQDIWDRPPSTFERWLEPTQAEGFDPMLWFLAVDQTGSEVAGFCLCKRVAGWGVVSTLGVRRPWRRKGLGLVLLHHAFGEFFRRGVREVQLSVDAESRTGAPRLYSRAGMHVTKSYVLYRRQLRPGQDLSVQAANE